MGRYGGGIWEIEARYSGGHEDLELAPLGVELLDVDLALHAVGGAVEPRVRDACSGSALGLGLGLGFWFWSWFWFWLGLGVGVGVGVGVVRDAALVEEDLDDVEHRGPPAQG